MLGRGFSRIFGRNATLAGNHQTIAKRCLGKFYPVDDDLFGLTEEQQQLRQTTFQFVQEELADKAQDIDKNNNFPGFRDFMKKCGKLGYLGVTCPVEYGGTGASFMDHVLIMEEMARASSAVCLSYGAHSNLLLNQIVRNGTDEQKENHLPGLCRGDKIGALAMSEVGSGSDVVSMRTTAEKKGDYYVLNGSKFWITNGPIADTLLVYAKTDVSAKQHGVTAFIIEEGMEGFSRGVALDKLGHRGSDTGELIFHDCKVPESNVLGGINRGVYVMFSGLDIERVIFSALALGVSQASCDVAFEYAHDREQFGTKIGKFQLIQGKMADMYASLQSCRSYLYNVTRALDNGRILTKDTSAVLLKTGELSVQLALDAVQIMGGNGYINDYPAGRLLRDSKLFTIGAGTTEIRQLIVGRAINDEYLK